MAEVVLLLLAFIYVGCSGVCLLGLIRGICVVAVLKAAI